MKKNYGFLLFVMLSLSAVAADKGLMIHFLPEVRNANSRVLNVDTNLIAKTVNDVGADYLVFTIGQNTGQYVSRNNSLSSICEVYKSRQLDRDLISDLVDSLSVYKKKLVLYLPFRAPQRDGELMACLGDTPERTPTTKVFIDNWSSVIREWSLRYSDNILGWWFDGTYNTQGISDESWDKICDAANPGLGQKLIAFNPGEGVGYLRAKMSKCQNWSAGEMNNISPILDSYISFSDDMRPHVLSRITKRWGGSEPPQFSCNELKSVTNKIILLGGMITIDVGYRESQGFFSEQIDLIRQAWQKGCVQ